MEANSVRHCFEPPYEEEVEMERKEGRANVWWTSVRTRLGARKAKQPAQRQSKVGGLEQPTHFSLGSTLHTAFDISLHRCAHTCKAHDVITKRPDTEGTDIYIIHNPRSY